MQAQLPASCPAAHAQPAQVLQELNALAGVHAGLRSGQPSEVRETLLQHETADIVLETSTWLLAPNGIIAACFGHEAGNTQNSSVLMARPVPGDDSWQTHSEAGQPLINCLASVEGWGQRFFGVLYEHRLGTNPLHAQVRVSHLNPTAQESPAAQRCAACCASACAQSWSGCQRRAQQALRLHARARLRHPE